MTNTAPIAFVEVRLKLPIDVYLAVEKRATAKNLGAGRLLSAFICKRVRPDADHDPNVTVTIVRKEPTGYDALAPTEQTEFRRLASLGTPARELAARFATSESTVLSWRSKLVQSGTITVIARKRHRSSGFDQLSKDDQELFCRLAAEGATGDALADRFGTSQASALAWRRKLVSAGAITRPARKTAVTISSTKRSYVKLSVAEQEELVQMFARGAFADEIRERFGLSTSSVTNWRARLTDRIDAAIDADRVSSRGAA
ncbi:hypothetical protein [Microbacterium gorillae]|uniref:hypothetical protein n=1 Tax=Microbacterium gorillae TaxID=1231063 RepID=UPI003D98A832